MKIRSITCFIEPEQPLAAAQVKLLERFIPEARQAFEEAGYTVQTTPLATATRSVISLSLISTMRARPEASRCVSLLGIPHIIPAAVQDPRAALI